MLTVITALALFAVTITLVIWQPKGLGIGWTAAGGALLALAAGAVTLEDVREVTSIVWNATFTLIAIVIYSMILDRVGFFEWCALHVIRLAGGNGVRLFLYTSLLGAGVSFFFANDGAVLILTPIILAQMRALRLPDAMILPFVMAGGFISDTTSIPLVISNLVNIISADYFGIGFARYASVMLLPNLFSLAASLAVLYLFYRKDIPAAYDLSALKKPEEAVRHMGMFRLSWYLLAVLLAGFFLSEPTGIPVSFIAGTAALLFVAAAAWTKSVSPKETLKEAPWSVVIFSIGMYVVVYGLRNAGLTELLGGLVEAAAKQGLWAAAAGMGFLSAGLSSVMNNLPSVMIGALAIDETSATGLLRETLAYANVIGCDLGPKMTPIGSLATLLWLHVLAKKDIRIGWGYYFRTGVVLTLPTLFFTLLGLWVSLLLFG
ncbi:arsenic transporter [Gorillibacterium sp. sgz5001074]|uniref:arsenic transporter n=1 Tax=Gorillibacterium sp. sgz5001074 TaxID=3446695 RepID=UPI003F66A493